MNCLKKGKIKILSIAEKVLPYYKFIELLTKYNQWVSRKAGISYTGPYVIPKKTKEKYCIFKYTMPNYMLFAAGIQYLYAANWAKSKGLIPLIDMELEYTFQQNQFEVDNIWHDVFEQKEDIEEIIKTKWVLITTENEMRPWNPKMCHTINHLSEDHFIHVKTEDWRAYYRTVNKYINDLWQFKESFLIELEQKYPIDKWKNEEKIVGVSLREDFTMDAQNIMPDNEMNREIYQKHPMLPGVEETIEIVKEYMQKWQCKKIFLAARYQESIDAFRSQFGDKMVIVDRERESMSGLKKCIERSAKELYQDIKENGFLQKNVPYANEILMLSKCDYLMGAKSSGTAVALGLNGGKYKDIYIFTDKRNCERY